MADTTEKTIADELREAAARLRNQGARAREATKTGHGDEWLPWETVAAHARDVTNPAARRALFRQRAKAWACSSSRSRGALPTRVHNRRPDAAPWLRWPTRCWRSAR